MGTVVHVPQTRNMIGEELSGDEALTALRHYGGRKLLVDAFSRFRYADGFSQARSLGFQVVLGMVPFTIALVGVAATVHTESVARVIELTLGRIVPGASTDLVQGALPDSQRSAGADWSGAVAMWLGLGFAVLNLASAMGQIFRWSPRRDQPGYTWLAFGSAVHLLLWVAATWLLAFCVAKSGSFGAVYGPLTAFVALLLWANLTGIALFLGVAFAAQLEAARVGIVEPVHPDPGPGP